MHLARLCLLPAGTQYRQAWSGWETTVLSGIGRSYAAWCATRWASLIALKPDRGAITVSLEQIKDLDRQFIEEILNGGDIEGCGRFCTQDVVEEVPLPGQGPGLAGLQGVLREMKAAFPDIHWTIHEQIAEGDAVVTRFEWTGTHRGPFFGVPATGKAVRVWGFVRDRYQNGKITHTRILMDTLGMMMQLGVVPAPGAT
jgi:steroid delta-isomerase-like uncharacterized protein